MKINPKYEDVLESLDWRIVGKDLETVDIENWSPAGENIVFTLNTDDVPGSAMKEYEDFDADEHAAMWIESRGKRGIPSSIRTLIDDADAIEEMLKELADRLAEVE